MAAQIKAGAILSYIALGLNVIIGLVFTPWVIKTIGTDDYGLYTLALSVITLFVFDFGLSTAVTRFIAKYLAENNTAQVNNVAGIIVKLYLYLDSVIFMILCAVWFFIPTIYSNLTPAELESFKVVFIISAAFSVISFPFIPLNGFLTAFEDFIQLKLCDMIHKVLIVIFLTLCLLSGLGLYALVSVYALSGLIVIFIKLYFLHKYTSLKINFTYSDRTLLKDILQFSGWTTVSSICQRLIFNIAPTILAMFANAASVAILGIAVTFERYTYTFANAINGLFLPKVTRIIHDNESELIHLMIKVGRLQIFIVGFLITLYIVLGKEFIYLWVGASFSKAFLCALLLIIPSFFQLPQEIGLTAIVVKNKVKLNAIVFIIMGIVNIMLMIPFAKYFGIIGIGWSIFISYMIRTLGLDWILSKHLGLDIALFFKKTFLKQMIPISLSVVLGLALSHFFDCNNWLSLIVAGILFTALYFGIFYLISFNSYEKRLLKDLLIRKKK